MAYSLSCFSSAVRCSGIEQMEKESQRVAVVVVPFPAQGHLNQLLNFCLHLSSLASDHIQVHYVNSPSHIRQVRSRAQGWNSTSLQNIHFHDFPVPPISAPPPDPNSPIGFPSHLQPLFDSFATTLQGHLSSLLRSLSSTCRRVVVVHEPITAFAGHAAKSIPNVESFRFQCIPVFYKLANSTIWHNKWKKNLDTPQAVLDIILTQFDGSVTPEFFEFLSKQNMDIPVEAGTLINTCRLVEGEFIDLLAREEPFCNMKLFAIGPLLPVAVAKQESGSRHWCLDWLDKQPSSSVVYISFGSTSTISDEQIEQLAIGLQFSKQRFLWVLRDADMADIFANEGCTKRRHLPLGFEEKVVGEMGIVVRDWAPQLEILAHSSTGCFVSHCGWNSCIESFTMGVPIVAWPIHSDQPRNAMMVTDYLKVGVLAREWSEREKTVKAEKIEESINRVMMVCGEGMEIRRRMKSLSEGIREAVSEGGPSRQDCDSFIDYITR